MNDLKEFYRVEFTIQAVNSKNIWVHQLYSSNLLVSEYINVRRAGGMVETNTVKEVERMLSNKERIDFITKNQSFIMNKVKTL